MASIEHRPSGPRVVWRLNRPADPEHQRKQRLECETLDEAEEVVRILDAHRGKLTQLEVESLVLGVPADEPGTAAISFETLCDQWLSSKTRISPRTKGDYLRLLTRRILPYAAAGDQTTFGHRPSNRFTPAYIGGFINSMRAEGLTNRTITRHYSVVFGAFAFAVRNKIITENPCSGTDFVRDQIEHDDTGDEDHVYLTPDEYQILHAAIPAEWQDFVEALIGTATRFGEVSALQPQDLIAPTPRDPYPRLYIRRAWKQDENGRYYLGTTKGRAKRKNRIDPELYELLLRCSAGKDPDSLIFTAPRGGRIQHQNFVIRVWNPSVIKAMRCREHPPTTAARPMPEPSGSCGDHGGRSRVTSAPCQRRHLAPGLDRCVWHAGPAPGAVSTCDCLDVLHRRPTPHDLRHTCVAWMLADPTVAPLYVSRYVGHASMQVTDKVYAGLMPSGEGSAVAAIAKARGRDQS